MGLLDNELDSKKSEYTRKPEWALCKYCRVPFLTSTFDDSCERCSHFTQYKIEFAAKIMILFIIAISLIVLISIGSLFALWTFTHNFNLILSIISLFTIAQGYIFWKIVKQIMNKYDKKTELSNEDYQ